MERLRPLAKEFGLTLGQLALRWCLRREEVAAVIVGATRPEQLDENLAAAQLTLDPQQVQAITGALA